MQELLSSRWQATALVICLVGCGARPKPAEVVTTPTEAVVNPSGHTSGRQSALGRWRPRECPQSCEFILLKTPSQEMSERARLLRAQVHLAEDPAAEATRSMNSCRR